MNKANTHVLKSLIVSVISLSRRIQFFFFTLSAFRPLGGEAGTTSALPKGSRPKAARMIKINQNALRALAKKEAINTYTALL